MPSGMNGLISIPLNSKYSMPLFFNNVAGRAPLGPALLGLTRTFAKDLGPSGITVNMLSGGLLKVTDASSATPDFVFDAIAEMTPLQKVTTIEDFSDAALFFASDQSRSITGQNLTVDGGLTFN